MLDGILLGQTCSYPLYVQLSYFLLPIVCQHLTEGFAERVRTSQFRIPLGQGIQGRFSKVWLHSSSYFMLTRAL